MSGYQRRVTSGPDISEDIRRLAQRVSDLESQRTQIITTAQAGATSTIPDHSITDTKMVANTLTGASISTGLALQGSLSTPYGFVNNSTGLFVTITSQFSYNSTFTDPDSGVQRDAKFGQKGIAVTGGVKTDALTVTGAGTISGGLTLTGTATFSTSSITMSQPTTFSSSATFSTSNVTFTGRPLLGSNMAFDTVTGAAGAGLGNIAGGTVTGYNVADNSLPYAKLTGTAQSQITALTVQDTPFSFLRRVASATVNTTADANGNVIDGFNVQNSATRVADAAAYAGFAITNTGMTTTGVLGMNGPNYTGLNPGQYQATFFLRLSAANAATTTLVNLDVVAGASALSPVVAVTPGQLTTTYVGIVVPFTVTATGQSVETRITNQMLPGSATWYLSHVRVQPSTGQVSPGAVQYYFANASITSAQIQSVTAGQVTAGTVTSDNIFIGTGGHIYLGTTQTSPTGNTARVELNAGGLYGYNGTAQTFALTNSGLTLTGTVNATAGTLGDLSVTGTLTGGTISGTTISAATITGTTSLSGATVTGGTIIGPLIETSSNTSASRVVLDSAYGLYVNLEGTTNYLTNPGAEYFSSPNNYITGWTYGSGAVQVVAAPYDVANSGTVLPLPPSHNFAKTAPATAYTVEWAIASGATTFQADQSITVGQYVSFNTDPALKITGSAAGTAQTVSINNPGFETGSFTNWTTAFQSGGTGQSYAVATGNAHSGTYSGNITTTSTTGVGSIATDAYPCSPGDVIGVSIWLKRSVASAGMIVQVDFGTTPTFVGGGPATQIFSGTVGVTYTNITGSVTIPAGYTYYRIEVLNWSGQTVAGTLYVDDLAVTMTKKFTYTLAAPTVNSYAAGAAAAYGEGEIQIASANLPTSQTFTVTANIASPSNNYFDAAVLYVKENGGAGRTYAFPYNSRFTQVALPAAGNTPWNTYTWTFTTPSDYNGPTLLYVSTARTNTGSLQTGTQYPLYYDNLQVERKSYATNYADGDLGPAYSWASTPGQSSSTRGLMKVVDEPQIGNPSIRGVLSSDGVAFPLSNSALLPDQGFVVGGLDLNGRGVQSTIATKANANSGTTISNQVVNFGMITSNQVVLKAGRLYKIVYTSLGIVCNSVTLGFQYSLIIAGSAYPNFTLGSTVTANTRGVAGTYSWYYKPTADQNGTIIVVVNGGTSSSGASIVTSGYDYLEITDMGVAR